MRYCGLLGREQKFILQRGVDGLNSPSLPKRLDVAVIRTAGVAQLVEHWIVAPVVAGSSPVARPIFYNNAPVVQLDRIPDFESVGRRFESCRARQFYRDH